VERLQRVGDLEIGQDLRFERRQYTARKVAAALGGLILLVALLGLFGAGGPLADATEESGPLSVEYERFARYEAQTEIEVQADAGGAETPVALGQSYLDDVSVEQISPEPNGTTVLPDRVIYTFDLEPGSSVTFELRPQEIGSKSVTVWGPDGARVEFSQLVYP
jgi:hypothetical protein